MAYEKDKDILLEPIAKIRNRKDDKGTYIRLGLYSYNGGEPKIGMNRYITNKVGDEVNIKLGRLSYREAWKISKNTIKFINAKRDAGEIPLDKPKVGVVKPKKKIAKKKASKKKAPQNSPYQY